MLFTKPITEITYQDVVDFCNEQNPESFILDYKRELPKPNDKLAKLIAAFANTYGGLLVIGINAPKGKPEPPFEGIDYDEKEKYAEKIQQIIISNITEPIFPEIHICPPDNNKTFIIVRVAESDITPHRVGNDKKIYIRTGEINTSANEYERSIDEASWGKIEWLASRRAKSIQLRNQMIDEAEIFYSESFRKLSIDPEKYFGIVTFRLLPLFPQGQLVNYKSFMNLESVIKVGYGENWFPGYPISLESIQNGLQRLYFTYTENHKNPKQYEPFLFIHLTNLGMYLYKWDAGIGEPETNPDGNTIFKNQRFYDLAFITVEVYKYLSSALQFYKHLGYWGKLLFEVEFNNVLGLSYETNIFNKLEIPRSHMKWSRNFMTSELESRKIDTVLDVMSDIAWSIGIRIDIGEHLRNHLQIHGHFKY